MPATVLAPDTAIDESKKETAKGVARFPNRFSRRDGHPLYYHHPTSDFLCFSPLSSFWLCRVSPFVYFPLPRF